MSITLRINKETPLTFDETDINFSSLYYSSSIRTNTSGDRFIRLHYSGSNELGTGNITPGRFDEIPLGVLQSQLDYTTPGGNNNTIQINTSGSFEGYDDFVRTDQGIGIGTDNPSAELEIIGRLSLDNGDRSIFIGKDSGTSDDKTNNYNTGIGYKSLTNNISGDENTGIGYRTLLDNTSGRRNTAVGFESLQSNITGTNNTSIGYRTANTNTIGSGNTTVGSLAGYLTSTNAISYSNSNSVYLGANTRPLNNGDINQIVIGYNTIGNGSNTVTLGNSNITRTILKGNVGIDLNSPDEKLHVDGKVKINTIDNGEGDFLTTSNTGVLLKRTPSEVLSDIEAQPLLTNPLTGTGESGQVSFFDGTTTQTGDNGLFWDNSNKRLGIGTTSPSQALDILNGKISLNDGGNSVYIGENAGINDDKSDNRNVGIGYETLKNNTTGYYNTAHGSFVLRKNTVGSRNTAIGYYTLEENTTGSDNTATGFFTLNNNTTGDRNTANGFLALSENTTGNDNTATGFYALSDNISGFRNTAYGYNAGKHIANGTSPNQTGNNSIFLGANTKANADGENNQIVVGYNAIGNGSNTVTLGNNNITDTYLKGDLTLPQGIYANGSLGNSGDLLTSTGTGLQWISGSDEFATNQQLDNYQLLSEKGQALGYTPLNSGSKIDEQYLPDSILGQVTYQGTWNADTNTPTLPDPPPSTTKGEYYVTDVGGTQFGIDFKVGDWIISNGEEWQKVDNTDAVTSVFGRLGNIQALASDYDAFYDNYQGWDLFVDGGTRKARITSEENVNFAGGTNVSLGYSSTNNTVTVNSTDTFLNSLSFNTGDGILTATLNNGSTATENLDDRYALNNSIGDGTLTLNTSGIAAGASSFSANQNSNSTFTVDVPGTNLTMGGSGNNRTVNSSTGNNVSIPIASTTDAGFLSTGDKDKLDRIEADAEVNVQSDWTATSGDAFIKNKPSLNISNWNTAYSWGDHAGLYDNYQGWTLFTNGADRGSITSGENLEFKSGGGISLSYATSNNNTVTFSHADTSTLSGTYGGADNGIVIEDITLDGYGHITGVGTRDLDSRYNNYIHPTFDGDDVSISTGKKSGATVISNLEVNVTTDTEGHVTDASGFVDTRELTPSDIGAQAALTNPITGTGSSGQVSFFNGTTTQTGDNGLFWDNSNKRLGIGTTSPNAALDILHNDAIPLRLTRSTAGQTAIRLTNGNANNVDITNDGANNFIISNTGTERMRIDSSGNVGIGTTSINAKLHIKGTNTTAKVLARFDGYLGGVDISYNDVYNNVKTYLMSYNRQLSRYQDLGIKTSGGEPQFVFKTNGNFIVEEGTITLNDGGNSVYIGQDAGVNDNRTDNRNTGIGYLTLQDNTSGYDNTGIGSLSLQNNTTGHSNTSSGFSSLIYNTSGEENTAIGYRAGMFTSSGGQNQTGDNSVFLGFDTRAQSNGQTNQIVIGSTAIGNGSNTVTIGNSSITNTYLKGDVSATGDVIANASDSRLKTNNQPIEKPLQKIKSLKGFTYNWNNKAKEKAGFNTQDRQVGVSAQEIKEVLPEAVKLAPFDNDGGKSKSGEDYLTVQYEKLTPLLIEGIKEQQEIIEKQQTQLDSLQEQINELKKLIK